jgi:hypothetical protein
VTAAEKEAGWAVAWASMKVLEKEQVLVLRSALVSALDLGLGSAVVWESMMAPGWATERALR